MKFFVSLILFCFINTLNAQSSLENAFDFWLGSWEVSWQDQQGNTLVGKNEIVRLEKPNVIQENFSDTNNQFEGTSISVYNPKTQTWHQAWADNQGAYFNFFGIIEEDRRIFTTDTSKSFIQRMIFYDIEENQFTWDWESSKDGGKNYKLNWRINYKRKD